MRTYRLLFRLSPPGVFGLPDGNKVVIAAKEGQEIYGPVLDTRTGQLVSHGTLSQYRAPEQVLTATFEEGDLKLSLNDNFLAITTEASDPQAAADRTLPYVDLFVQSLSTMYGMRFFFEFLSAEDDSGSPQVIKTGPQALQLFNLTIFNLEQLRERIAVATRWAASVDAAAKKALFYFEHACLLNEFAQTLPLTSHHASFSRAVAFLQMFKALTSIIGESGTDHDYQRRLHSLGFPKDFWPTKVKPLYAIRNDEDVAHYSHSFPEPGAFFTQFSQATSVFSEALTAYMKVTEEKPADIKS